MCLDCTRRLRAAGVGRLLVFIEAFREKWPTSPYGPAHILIEDYNLDPEDVAFCATWTEHAIAGTRPADEPHFPEYSDHSPAELRATLRLLQALAVDPDIASGKAGEALRIPGHLL